MAWLPLYIDHIDSKRLIEHLNKDEEIAFLVYQDPTDWKAVTNLPTLPDGDYYLWHTVGAPLPILIQDEHEAREFIVRSRWLEGQPERDRVFPHFGVNSARHVTLNVRTSATGKSGGLAVEMIGISGFQWLGDRHKNIGNPAPHSTKNWWNRLVRWVSKNARKIPRQGPLDGPCPEIWAFPSALNSITQGRERALNS